MKSYVNDIIQLYTLNVKTQKGASIELKCYLIFGSTIWSSIQINEINKFPGKVLKTRRELKRDCLNDSKLSR